MRTKKKESILKKVSSKPQCLHFCKKIGFLKNLFSCSRYIAVSIAIMCLKHSKNMRTFTNELKKNLGCVLALERVYVYIYDNIVWQSTYRMNLGVIILWYGVLQFALENMLFQLLFIIAYFSCHLFFNCTKFWTWAIARYYGNSTGRDSYKSCHKCPSASLNKRNTPIPWPSSVRSLRHHTAA